MAIGYKSGGGGYAVPRYESAPAPAPAPAPASLPYRTEVQYPVDYGYPDEQYPVPEPMPEEYGGTLPHYGGYYVAPQQRYQEEPNYVMFAGPSAPRGVAQQSRYGGPGGYDDASEWNRGFYDAVKARATQWMDDPSVQNAIARQRLRDMPG